MGRRRARSIRPPATSLAPRPPHFAPKAKRVIHLFMAGAPSQLDLFDYKPALRKFDGKPLPAEVVKDQRYAFIRPDAACCRRGSSSPGTGSAAPSSRRCCRTWRRSSTTSRSSSRCTPTSSTTPRRRSSSTPASPQPGRPSLGSWVLLRPGQRVARPARLRRDVDRQRASAAARPTGRAASCRRRTRACRSATKGDPILNVSSPPGVDRRLQRDSLDLIGELNRRHLGDRRRPGDRHPDRLVRDGLPAADIGPRADGPRRRDARRPWRSTAPSRTSRRSPATACWPAG